MMALVSLKEQPFWVRVLKRLDIPLVVGLPVWEWCFAEHWVVTKIVDDGPCGGTFCWIDRPGSSGTSIADNLVPDITTDDGLAYLLAWLNSETLPQSYPDNLARVTTEGPC
jgi:hypothetical protein